MENRKLTIVHKLRYRLFQLLERINTSWLYVHRMVNHLKLRRSILRNKSGDVYIGAVFSNMGGVPHHINALCQYSDYKLVQVPDRIQIEKISRSNLKETFEDQFLKLYPKLEFKMCHSHVDPWFISFCKHAHTDGIKWIHTYHTLYFEKDWENGLSFWQKEINQFLINVACLADKKISVSKWLQDTLQSKYGIESVYIPNGIDVAKSDLASAERFLEKYQLDDFVLFASGISDIKNPIDFIRMAEKLNEYQFVMIGRGVSVEALAKKYHISIPENLIVFGEMVHNELLDAIAACKVFVVTSRSEGLPTVLMEAMALKRNVVGCDTYGTKEVIGDEKYGYIYDHTSIEDLILKTQEAFNGSKGTYARQRILENYDWKVVIPQIDNLYRDLVCE